MGQVKPFTENSTDSGNIAASVAARLASVLDNRDELAAMSNAAIVELVLTGVNDVQSGDSVGTVRRRGNGMVYVRINDAGVHKWRVVDPSDGSVHDDMQDVSYPKIADPIVVEPIV
jgi:hypothetical protein